MKEEILKVLGELGFQLEPLGSLGYGFVYEGGTYIYMPDKNDPELLILCIPYVYEIDKDNPLRFYMLIDEVNAMMKGVKAYELNDEICFFYERELLGEDDLEKIIVRMIYRLEAALTLFHNKIAVKCPDEAGEEENEELIGETKE